MKFFKTSVMTLITTIVTLSASNAFALVGQNLVKDAKLTIVQARTIALKARPGKITDEELEKEKGGSGLRYSFDIIDGTVTYEVGVDAVDGTLLENAPEGANPD
ncbi:MAG: PepSY domain-containing protein [Chitinophagaceae bacterium]|nr:PepSY domain-containing protein [Oligoflexus sp.]